MSIIKKNKNWVIYQTNSKEKKDQSRKGQKYLNKSLHLSYIS